MSVSFAGEVVIVTGAGRGLGRAYALDLVRHGAAVLVNDVSEPDAQDVVDAVTRDGGRAAYAVGDVAEPDTARLIVDEATRLGRLAGLVNNAGLLRNGWLPDLTREQIERVLAVHLTGSIFVAQRAFEVMRDQGYGRIVNISSGGAFGVGGMANYCAAKAGALGLTAALAAEGERHGVLVNSVLPNARTTIADADPILGYADEPRFGPAYRAIRRRLAPELTAPLVTFLCSAAATVTGRHYSSVGGRYARVAYAVASGWLAGDDPPTADDIAAHLDDIERLDDGAVHPTNAVDELEAVARTITDAGAAR